MEENYELGIAIKVDTEGQEEKLKEFQKNLDKTNKLIKRTEAERAAFEKKYEERGLKATKQALDKREAQLKLSYKRREEYQKSISKVKAGRKAPSMMSARDIVATGGVSISSLAERTKFVGQKATFGKEGPVLKKTYKQELGPIVNTFTVVDGLIEDVTQRVQEIKPEYDKTIAKVEELGLTEDNVYSSTIQKINGEIVEVKRYRRELNGILETYRAIDGEIVKREITKAKAKPEVQKEETSYGTAADFGLTQKDVVSSTSDIVNGIKRTITMYQRQTKEGTESFKEINGQISSMTKSTKVLGGKKGLGGLLDTFKRVGKIRIVRRIFQLVEMSIKAIITNVREGIKQFAIFDKNTNKSISQINSSFQMLVASIGSIFAPLADTVAPMVQSLAFAFADVANALAEAEASMKGLSTYTKINKDYMQDYASTVNSTAFAFDKFNTLSQGNNAGLFGQSSEIANAQKELSPLAGLFKNIREFLSDIFKIVYDVIDILLRVLVPILKVVFDILNPIMSLVTYIIEGLRDSLAPLIDSIGRALSLIFDYLGFGLELAFTYLKPILDFVFDIIDALSFILIPLLDLIADTFGALIAFVKGDMDSLGVYMQRIGLDLLAFVANACIGIINIVISLFWNIVNFVITGINALLKPISAIVQFFGGKGIGEIPKINYQDKLLHYLTAESFSGMFANGGIASAGSLFVAGEAGPEAVWNNSNGSSSILNIAQFKEAMLQAIYEADIPALIATSGGGDIYLDSEKVGTQVGKTQGLTRQLSRRNPAINWR